MVTYLAIYIAKYGIPEHLSATYNKFGIWFTVMIWFICFNFSMIAFDKYLDLGWLSFILSSSLMFVGASPMLDESIEGLIHRVAATLSIIISFVWVIFINPFGLLGYILLIFCRKYNWLFWVEMACFTSIFLNLLLF